jgi:hypothetical protein
MKLFSLKCFVAMLIVLYRRVTGALTNQVVAATARVVEDTVGAVDGVEEEEGAGDMMACPALEEDSKQSTGIPNN